MEVEEIKREYSMRDILARYGIQVNRSGMCCCPIHGERHPSMKVYKDSFYCFACGAHGDIFSFIQQMDNCDFKTAYLSLGGTYEKQTENQRVLAQKQRELAQNERERRKQKEAKVRQELIEVLDIVRDTMANEKPQTIEDLSDLYCLCANWKVIFESWWEAKYIEESEVNMTNVYRGCQRFRQEYNSLAGSNDRAIRG
jgi:DNA primase